MVYLYINFRYRDIQFSSRKLRCPGGLVVEYSPATRETRVRFPAWTDHFSRVHVCRADDMQRYAVVAFALLPGVQLGPLIGCRLKKLIWLTVISCIRDTNSRHDTFWELHKLSCVSKNVRQGRGQTCTCHSTGLQGCRIWKPVKETTILRHPV